LAGHLSLCWQPRSGAHAEARDYFPAYDELFARIGERFATRALHHPAPSYRAAEAYRLGELLEVTNALVDRYGFGWVTEDAALWPIRGKPPNDDGGPSLTHEELRAAARHARVVRAGLEAPLVLDFPSFAATAGDEEATRVYDFFRALADEADVAVSIDTGKILANQARCERTDVDSADALEKLPLGRCFEIRVSARDAVCDARNDRSFDAEVELVERLVGLCPNVRAIVCEVPTGAAESRTDRTLSVLARLRDAIDARRLFSGPLDFEARI
jgi:hypothetical protein